MPPPAPADPIGAMLEPPRRHRPAACRAGRAGTGERRDDAAPQPKPPRAAGSALHASLLYGRDVDRDVKAKARLGLAIVAFAGDLFGDRACGS